MTKFKPNSRRGPQRFAPVRIGIGVAFLDVIEALELLKKAFEKSALSIEDFKIGFRYEELEQDRERYMNKGLIWVKKTYNFNSPRLFKMNKLLKKRRLRRVKY